MGSFFDTIPENLIAWIQTQHIFWVATAPLSPNGHVNVSPKGINGTFHIIDESTVWYEDLTGSGVETISHVRENGRVTIMFSAFDGPPRIVRLWGTGIIHEFGTPEYEKLIPPHTRKPGSRAAIVISVHKVGSSCGYAVPYYSYTGPRDILDNWNSSIDDKDFEFESQPSSKPDAETFADKGLRYWQHEWNQKSLDGLKGLEVAHKTPLMSVITKRPEKKVKSKASKKEEPVQATKSGSWLGEARLLLAFILGLVVATLVGRYEAVLRDVLGMQVEGFIHLK